MCAFLVMLSALPAKDAHGLASHAMRRQRASGILGRMNERSLRLLLAHRATLHSQWAARLRATPFTSPLGHPDTLVHLMDRTLDQVFEALQHPAPRRRQPTRPRDYCPCGQNPLVAYFDTAFLAFETTLARCADETPITRDDVDDVKRVLTRIARNDILTFCGLCRRNHAPDAESASHGKPHPDCGA